ncbi:MAG TPA: ferric reductase-like transmembrane domain-containing protein [Dehalococcoidia bacterium]|nr:ferric reductase-like transmembrane domain-containing protein [Dehalococcoidia bacterium]
MSHELWFLTRAAGITAYLLLFASVALGISIRTRISDRVAHRSAVFDLHQTTTLLALAVALLHVLTLLGDTFIGFGPLQLAVPFRSAYRPLQVAAGIFSMYLLAIIVGSFYARRFIGYRAWRALHYLTFGLFLLVLVHGVTAGSDTQAAWARWMYALTGAAVVALVVRRVQPRGAPGLDARRIGAGALAMGTTALVLLIAPVAFTGHAGGGGDGAQAAASTAGTADGGHPFVPSFDADISGTYVQQQGADGSHLLLTGTVQGDLTLGLSVQLDTQAGGHRDDEASERVADDEQAEGDYSVTVNRATLSDPQSNSVICAGRLTQLDDGYMRLTCDGVGPYDGVRMSVTTRISASRDGTFSGPLSGTMQRVG